MATMFNSTAQLTLFALIMMRMSGFVLMNPIFGRNTIPSRVKAGMIFVLTLMVYSSFTGEAFETASMIEFAFLLCKEFVAGYLCHAIVFFYHQFYRLYHRLSDGLVYGYSV